MSSLPERPHLDHLRKQAKELLRDWRAGDAAAFQQLRQYLPAAKGRSDAELSALPLHLRDAQSCIARQYGFPSWQELKDYVDWKVAYASGKPDLFSWLSLLYSGDVTGGRGHARPALALRILGEHPQLAHSNVYVGCALGDEARIREAIAAEASWVNRAGGLLKLPPLVAVTHSSLGRNDAYRERLRRCVRLLLEAGANPKQSIGNRNPPDSLEKPGGAQLTALYGAASQAQDPQMSRMLLIAGADPNDGESLYHAAGSEECVRVLLEHGARPDSNILANAIAHSNVGAVRLLLQHGADANAAGAQHISPLVFAIRGRRPAQIVSALLEHGADPHVRTPDNQSAYKYALAAGLPEIAAMLEKAGAREDLSIEDAFVAACACCDEREARRLLALQPDIFERLGSQRLRCLPEMVWNGCDAPARLMVQLGWPIAARGGDEPFFGSALNWAVFRGNAPMTQFLLEHGASWTERHGYEDNVMGTLSWSSMNQPPEFGDYAGCARALVAHGMPRARRPEGNAVEIDGRVMKFSEEVVDALLSPSS